MLEYQLKVELQELKNSQDRLAVELGRLAEKVFPANELWDGQDICLNWKVSPRTLAAWRSKRLIGYVKINGKIWYPKEERNKFLSTHLCK